MSVVGLCVSITKHFDQGEAVHKTNWGALSVSRRKFNCQAHEQVLTLIHEGFTGLGLKGTKVKKAPGK